MQIELGIEGTRICTCDGYVPARIRTRGGYVPAIIRTRNGNVAYRLKVVDSEVVTSLWL